MDAEVTREVVDAIRKAAISAHPREACGILLGDGKRILRCIEARNIHPTPESHFEIDPQALIDAHKAERAGGLAVMGYFHSHPTGDPRPSETDRAMSAGDGKVWAIVAGGDVAMWLDEPEGFRALSYSVIEG